MSFIALLISEIQSSKVDQKIFGHFLSKNAIFLKEYCGHKKRLKMSFWVVFQLLGHIMIGKCPKSRLSLLLLNKLIRK